MGGFVSAGNNLKKLLPLFFILYVNFSFSQSFQISHVPAEYFSLDKFTNDVYYAEIGSWDLYLKNLEDSTIRICPFPSLPVFANKSHKCVYGDEDSIFVYEFETNKSIKICESVGGSYGALGYTFSPNDEYVLFKDHYYSFTDSSLHPIDFTPDPYLQMEWVTETKFVWFFNDYLIASFDILANELDTVLVSSSNLSYAAFAFNKSNNLLYYALSEVEYPKIHSYDLNMQSDSVVFNTENDTTDICWWTYNFLREMEWSPDSSRMAFFSEILDAGGTIYTYSPADERLYKYINCGGEGYEYHLKWLNNDTIVYFNGTLGFVYGFALDDPLAVREIKGKDLPSSLKLYQNYPNPFNPVTNISYSIPQYGLVTIKVYNTLGEEVATLVNKEKPPGTYEVKFNCSTLPSGVYIYRLSAGNYSAAKKLVLLK
jgi:hypothetical protein